MHLNSPQSGCCVRCNTVLFMVQIQTEPIPTPTASEYNQEALLEFMRRVVPQVETELRKRNKYFAGDFKQNLSEEDEIPTKKLYDLQKCDRLKDVSISSPTLFLVCNVN